jgi:hypothetical protein
MFVEFQTVVFPSKTVCPHVETWYCSPSTASVAEIPDTGRLTGTDSLACDHT